MSTTGLGMRLAVMLLASLAFGGGGAFAQYPIAKRAFSCQDKSSKTLASFVKAKSHCITSCQRRARQGKNPFSDCDPPSFGGETATCIFDAHDGAEGKATTGIIKACSFDCPSCFSGGDCTTAADAHVGVSESLVDELSPLIYCATGGNASQNTCRESVVDSIAKYARRHTKCYRDCFLGAQKGKIAEANCQAPVPTDPKTNDCLAGAATKTTTLIEKGCFRPRAEAPPCYDGTQAPNTASGWTDLARATFDTAIPMSFCGSPSGAFLE